LSLGDRERNGAVPARMHIGAHEAVLPHPFRAILLDDAGGLVMAVRAIRDRLYAVALVFDRGGGGFGGFTGSPRARQAVPDGFELRKRRSASSVRARVTRLLVHLIENHAQVDANTLPRHGPVSPANTVAILARRARQRGHKRGNVGCYRAANKNQAYKDIENGGRFAAWMGTNAYDWREREFRPTGQLARPDHRCFCVPGDASDGCQSRAVRATVRVIGSVALPGGAYAEGKAVDLGDRRACAFMGRKQGLRGRPGARFLRIFQ
jgi:hypothetical protein